MNMTTTKTVKTAKRVYWISVTTQGGFEATYRPINAKTGEVWQAFRHLEKGRDCQCTTEQGYTYSAYSTEEKAFAAVREHLLASKLTEIS
jgi:hypothetical protein